MDGYNTTITTLNQCQYIAYIIADREIPNASIPTLIVPSGVYAKTEYILVGF